MEMKRIHLPPIEEIPLVIPQSVHRCKGRPQGGASRERGVPVDLQTEIWITGWGRFTAVPRCSITGRSPEELDLSNQVCPE